MGRVLPVLVVLLAVLAVAWFLRPTEVAEERVSAEDVGGLDGSLVPPLAGQPARVTEAHLEGRPDAVAPATPGPRPASVRRPAAVLRCRIHGTVRDETGQPVPGATVYQLSRLMPSGTFWVRETGETDEQGVFSFLGRPPAGTWICARLPGRRRAFVDGADVTQDGEIHLVLEEAPPLVVHLVDGDGAPVVYGTVRALPVASRGAELRFPGPDAPVPEQLEMTGEDGTATFHFERRVPVVVRPEVESMVTVPPEFRVPDGAGTVTFEVLSAGGLELKAVDATGARIRAALWVSVLDPRTGEPLAAYRASEDDGALEAEPPVPPGPYHLDVSALGYEPVLVPDVVLPQGPAVVEHTVTLAPLGDGATLRILLPVLSAETPGTRRRSAPTVFASRTDGGWAARGWTRRGEFRWDEERSAVVLTLRPGTWEILVCRPQNGTVAALGPLTLRPGKIVERHGSPAPGVSFALYEVLPPDLSVRAVRIRVPGVGLLPPAGTWYSTSIVDAGGLVDTIARPGSKLRREMSGPLLGPYPGSHVVLEVDDWSGETHRFTVR